MIKNNLVITEYKNKILCALDCSGKFDYLNIYDPETDYIGNIYNARIQSVVKNINACFADINGRLVFISFNDIPNTIRIVEGEIIPVQIVKEASKDKEMTGSCYFTLKGKYSIVENRGSVLAISKKINATQKEELRKFFSNKFKYRITLRTKAADTEIEEINSEINDLVTLMDDILIKSNTRTAGSCIYKSNPGYIGFINSLKNDSYDRIITDIQTINEAIPESIFYNDNYSLSKLYSIETKMNEILSSHIWLKSGGSIVINITEAMAVIDVNSGKNMSKKSKDEMTLKINVEAAEEIARQIRLRNLSGIIIIDFINMNGKEAQNELIKALKEYLYNDIVRCDFVDITKLGLVELVRKKTTPPIYEII